MAPHGATGLLNELLAEEAARKVDDASCQEGLDERQEELNEDDLAKEIYELHGEMDECLDSLEQWQKDREQARLALEKELEAKYAQKFANLEDEDKDEFRDDRGQGIDDAEPDSEAVELVTPVDNLPAERQLDLPDTIPCQEDIDSRRQDDARLSGLRAEVEELRIRAARQEEQQHRDAALFSEALDRGSDDSLGLTQWCTEIDAVLAETPDGLEGDLLKAQNRVNKTEGGLESIGCRIEAELNELEKMLEDCSNLRSQMSIERASA